MVDNEIREVIQGYIDSSNIKYEIHDNHVIIENELLTKIQEMFGPELFDVNNWFNTNKFIFYGFFREHKYFDIVEIEEDTILARATGRKNKSLNWDTHIFDSKNKVQMKELTNYFIEHYE